MPPKRKANTPRKPPLQPTGPPPPSPLRLAPPSLEAFLSTLSKPYVYLTTLDNHPREFKRRLFAIPLILNCFLVTALCYRAQYAIPTYWSLFLSVLGHKTEHTIDVYNEEPMNLLLVGGERTFMLMGDFLLLRFIGMWPYEFFLGRAGKGSPIGWRRWVGFKDTEIVVRRSRRWDVGMFGKGEDGRGDGDGDAKQLEHWLENARESEEWRERIAPAVDKEWVRKKTGYLMMDKSWDLHFQGMVEAHNLVDQGKNKLEDFRTACFIYTETWGWLTWEVWKKHEEGKDEEGSQKMQIVKDRLTRMGKESLFFRWIEIVQNETSQAGSFTREKQQKAVQKIREEFEEQGVDYDAVWKDVGGVELMPGMELTH